MIRIVVLAGLALVVGAAAVQAGGPPRVVATDGDGRIVADLPAAGGFELAYRHSYYRQPAVERFRLAGDGFELTEIASPSQAVLDYYEAEGTRARQDGWWTLELARPARFERMPLAATAVGRRTLVADGERVPLFGRTVKHLTIGVER